MNHTVAQHGFAIVPNVIDTTARQELIALLGPVKGAGRRGLLAIPQVAALAQSSAFMALVRPHLPREPVAVRAIYFDKSPDANWLVPWHQDLTLAMAARAESPGFGPWSVKDGIPHAQAPIALLENMLTVRLHLDDADETNGALRVVPGSHRMGKIDADTSAAMRRERAEHLCAAVAGDVMLMRPLLLHASSRSTSDRHRRVLHVEYAGFELPDGLRWNTAA